MVFKRKVIGQVTSTPEPKSVQGSENITVKSQAAPAAAAAAPRAPTTDEKVAQIENYLNNAVDPALKSVISTIEGLKGQFGSMNEEISKLTGVQIRVSTAIDQKFNEIIAVQNALANKINEIQALVEQFETVDSELGDEYAGEDLYEDATEPDVPVPTITIPPSPPI